MLTLENTVHAATVNHRLAMGVQWVDAPSGQTAGGFWTSDLEAIGTRPCALRFDLHPHCRHALRAAGRLARLLRIAAQDKVTTPPATPAADPTNFVLRAYGRTSLRIERYTTGNDPRRYVPRRLSMTPAQADGVPSPGLANIRSAWLWPGSTYPLGGHATALRGRVRRGAAAKPVAWTRVVATRPGPGLPNFAAELQLGHAHGDDRGEFLLVLGGNAVPGTASLPDTIKLNVWVFLPPADVFDLDDPLASVPLETAGTDALNEVLRGTQPPAAYLRQDAIGVTLAPGTAITLNEADLLFA